MVLNEKSGDHPLHIYGKLCHNLQINSIYLIMTKNMFCEVTLTFDHPIQVKSFLIQIWNILGMCSHEHMDKLGKHNASGICYDNPKQF